MAKKKKDILETMTIDDLGRMVVQGFEELESNLTRKLSGELTGLEKRLGRKIDKLRLDEISLDFDSKKLNGRVERLESRVFGSVQEA